MFEAAEVGRRVARTEYEEALPALRASMLDAQFALAGTDVPVIVIISGVDGAGKGEVVNRLHEWLDARGLQVHAFGAPSDEESERPRYWRYWRCLPARGRIGILFGSWYTDPIIDTVMKRSSQQELDQRMRRVALFERMLAEDGALIIKLWFHLSRPAQKEKFSKLESNPDTAWRVTPQDWKHFKLYKRFRAVCERALRQTDTGEAPWILVESACPRYRDLMVGRTLVESLQRRMASPVVRGRATPVAVGSPPPSQSGQTILDSLQPPKPISDSRYKKRMTRLQAEIAALVWKAKEQLTSTVAVFEGWDAAGKGGAIRRLDQAVDARLSRVISVAAPTDEERAHHYLWRFWRHLPRGGHVTIYDRSWYGRVLVERVEGFAGEDEWQRAYIEINEFEEQLVEAGIVLMKFWLHITPDEQLRRFKEREKTPWKQHKITAEDWRNRDKWDAYESAVNDMVARTSTEYAPWTVLDANDKRHARLGVLGTFAERLSARL